MVDLRCSVCFWRAVYFSLHLILPLCVEASHDHPRQAEDSSEGEEGSGLSDNTTNSTPTTPQPPPILSGSAIANIICGVLAIAFLTGYLCYLMYSFSKNERKSRVRTALQNNRQIDEQIARAKARAAAKQKSQEAGSVHNSGDSQSPLMASTEPASTGVDSRTSDSELQLDSSSSRVGDSENREALRV